MVAPFAVAVYYCLTRVGYGDGQDMKVVEVPWSCRSIEGFKGQACQRRQTFSYISKVQNGPGGF